MGVVKHMHIAPEIPSNLGGNAKHELFQAYTNMMKDTPFSICRIKLSTELLPAGKNEKLYGVLIAETETKASFGETYTHNTPNGAPIILHNFSYDTSLEEDWVNVDSNEEDAKMARKLSHLQDGDHVNKGLWNKFMNMAKTIFNFMSGLASTTLSLLIKSINFFNNTWRHIKPAVINWVLQNWGLCDKIAQALPFGASLDELVSLAGQVEDKRNSFLSFILDRIPQWSPVISKVLLFVGSALSIVDAAFAIKKAYDANQSYKECSQNAQQISSFLKESSSQASTISEVLPSCNTSDSYATAIGTVEQTAKLGKANLKEFSKKHLEKAKTIQKSRSDSSLFWAISRIALDIFATLGSLLVANFVAALIQFVTNVLRYVADSVMKYFEDHMVKMIIAVDDAYTLLQNQKFIGFIPVLHDINLPDTAREMKLYSIRLGVYHQKIEDSSNLSFYTFLRRIPSLFKEAMQKFYENVVETVDIIVKGVDYVCEKVKEVSVAFWNWLKEFFGCKK